MRFVRGALGKRLSPTSGRGEQHVSDTLFRNVRVLAIGQSIETKGDKKTVRGDTATLELTPRQAELVALARSMGEISLALRSLADSQPSRGGDGNNNPLFKRDRGSSVRLLRYGVLSRAYGVE